MRALEPVRWAKCTPLTGRISCIFAFPAVSMELMAISLQTDVGALCPGRFSGTRLPRPEGFSIEHVPCEHDREADAEASAALVYRHSPHLTLTARARAPAPAGSHPLPAGPPEAAYAHC
jgi:hypothetical protein